MTSKEVYSEMKENEIEASRIKLFAERQGRIYNPYNQAEILLLKHGLVTRKINETFKLYFEELYTGGSVPSESDFCESDFFQ